jgi:hypothetical protein
MCSRYWHSWSRYCTSHQQRNANHSVRGFGSSRRTNLNCGTGCWYHCKSKSSRQCGENYAFRFIGRARQLCLVPRGLIKVSDYGLMGCCLLNDISDIYLQQLNDIFILLNFCPRSLLARSAYFDSTYLFQASILTANVCRAPTFPNLRRPATHVLHNRGLGRAP